MKDFFVDLHVHVGRSSAGVEVKKGTAQNLTFENIAHESYYRKGIQVIGVVDCASPHILQDVETMLERGEIEPKAGGGMQYRQNQLLLLGAEVETHEMKGCSAHSLCFFPTLEQMKAFSQDLGRHVKNLWSNALMSRLTGQELFRIVEDHGGLYMPAHAFTPHKSFYGNCCDSLHEIFDEASFQKIPAAELGLSADSMMASQLSELDGKAFISNSDAHSLMKMGREYNIFRMEDTSYDEVEMALRGKAGRSVKANYGLNPMLGKYHRTFCLQCDTILEGPPPVLSCPVSPRHRVVVGVRDRLFLIRDRDVPDMINRPPYHYQIPLEFLPHVGPKTIQRLIDHFGNEMRILHDATFEELAAVVKEEIARKIILAREGKLSLEVGGGGVYGRVES